MHLKNFYYAEKKPIHMIVKELLQYTIYEKELPMFYFMNMLYRPQIQNIKDFYGGKKLKKLTEIYLSKNIFLDNKLLFHYKMNSLGYKTPNIYAYSSNNILYRPYSKDHIKDNFFELSVKRLLDKNKLEKIFIKPFDESGGKHCILYDIKTNENLGNSTLDMISSGFLFQEVLKQDQRINEIYPYSINTIRIYTLRDECGNINVISAVMRFGINNSNTDNASSGGFFVPINIENGTLEKEGIQLLKHGGNIYRKHPNTDYKFEGFKIPKFNDIMNKSKKASENFTNKMIGWDVTIQDDEVVFIEGNSSGSLLMAQIACGGFNSHTIYSKLLDGNITI